MIYFICFTLFIIPVVGSYPAYGQEVPEEQGISGTQQGISGTQQGISGTQQGISGTQQGISGTQQGISGTQQEMAGDAIQQIRMLDPQLAQEMSEAIQRGDFETAKKIWEDFNKKKAEALKKQQLQTEPTVTEQSIFERTMSGEFPTYILLNPLKQFGYNLFLKSISSFTPLTAVSVGSDYIIGPGDQFTVTIWGTAEGIYNFKVSREGNITLPKVGVVRVAGVRFGELENTLSRHLSRYYSNFNLSVAMGSLKTITVYVVGEVVKPGSYALNSLTTAYGALFAAGGPTKKGTMRKIQILRNGKVIKNMDLYDFLLNGDRSQDARLENEDTIFVPLIGPVAGVSGSVYRPAIYEYTSKGETLGDLLQLAGGIMPFGLANRVQISRFSGYDRKLALDVKLSAAAVTGQEKVPELSEKIYNMDTISVFPIYDKVWDTVNLKGDVRNPGNYQWRPDLRLKEIIDQGQLLPTSDLQRAEIIRLTKDFTDREVIPIDLEALLKGDAKQNILLQPKDDIRVYTTYREVEKVFLSGEVLKPGEYEVYNGEHLSDVLKRAGGFTTEAYPYGTIFARKSVKNTQAKNFQIFINKLETQVAQVGSERVATAVSAEEAEAAKTEAMANKSLIDSLKALQETSEGRIAINITLNIDVWAKSKDDLLLQNGDSITIPKRPQDILVIGEVHNPSAQIYVDGLTVNNYIANSGNITKYADKDEIYVLKANGFAVSKDSPSVGKNLGNLELAAGDAVFVPQQVERHAFMRFLKDTLDILFKTAVIAATTRILF